MNLPPHLTIRGDHLWIGEHDTVDLSRTWGTPLYVTDQDRIAACYTAWRDALSAEYSRVRILYAAKANGNLAVLRTLAGLGAGADVFSSGELHLALSAGIQPGRLLFNGSSKSRSDLALAVDVPHQVQPHRVAPLVDLAEEGAHVEIAGDVAVVAAHPRGLRPEIIEEGGQRGEQPAGFGSIKRCKRCVRAAQLWRVAVCRWRRGVLTDLFRPWQRAGADGRGRGGSYFAPAARRRRAAGGGWT